MGSVFVWTTVFHAFYEKLGQNADGILSQFLPTVIELLSYVAIHEKLGQCAKGIVLNSFSQRFIHGLHLFFYSHTECKTKITEDCLFSNSFSDIFKY